MMGYELPVIFGERQKSGQNTGARAFLGLHATREERRSLLPLLCFCLIVLIDSYLISVVKDKKDNATRIKTTCSMGR